MPSPSPRQVLRTYRHGAGDPTTRLGANEFWRATLTPDGPGTLHLWWDTPAGGDAASADTAAAPTVDADAWGPGAQWLLASVPAFSGALDPGHRFADAHPAIMAAQRNHPTLRLGASGTPYHDLLPIVLEQRITTGEAIAQWHRLVHRLGEPAPGPFPLLLPPSPDALLGKPTWWFHPLGIERRRAETLREIARHAAHVHQWATLPAAEAGERLSLLDGVGQWTIGSVLAASWGHPDAVAVGDFHLKNIVVHALTGRARGTDDEMLELLAPYAGQRGRVVQLLLASGHRAPAFGPRRRVVSMRRW